MDPSQGHLKWSIILSQQTPAVGIHPLGNLSVISVALVIGKCSTLWEGHAPQDCPGSALMYTADAGSEELLFRPQ